jgi:hypothetical protein
MVHQENSWTSPRCMLWDGNISAIEEGPMIGFVVLEGKYKRN